MPLLKYTLAVIGLATALSAAGPVRAHDYRAGALAIAHPWSRATPSGAQVGAAYMTITNRGPEPDRLLGGSTPAAGRVEVHEMRMEGDVMRMRALAGGLEIAPGDSVGITPGGYHLMLTPLKTPLRQGERVPLTLEFAKAGKVEVELVVMGVGAKGAADHPDHGAADGSTPR